MCKSLTHVYFEYKGLYSILKILQNFQGGTNGGVLKRNQKQLRTILYENKCIMLVRGASYLPFLQLSWLLEIGNIFSVGSTAWFGYKFYLTYFGKIWLKRVFKNRENFITKCKCILKGFNICYYQETGCHQMIPRKTEQRYDSHSCWLRDSHASVLATAGWPVPGNPGKPWKIKGCPGKSLRMLFLLENPVKTTNHNNSVKSSFLNFHLLLLINQENIL